VSRTALLSQSIKTGFRGFGLFRRGFNEADLPGFQLICAPPTKTKKAEPLLALPLSIGIRF
jgi:hypothetical protein